jgi:indole-3-glycerol phosphate synthase
VTILDTILATKRDEVAAAKRSVTLDQLDVLAAAAGPLRPFTAALTRMPGTPVHVLAEIKRASPSAGAIRAGADPAVIAASYADAGASAISVLTDREYFDGDLGFLRRVRDRVGLPLLRKDFLIDPYQVYESRAMGADCILLIVACLDDARLAELEAVARSLDMAVLVEVHDRAELDRALKLKTPLLGINNRNLRSFEVTLDTTLDMLPHVPKDRLPITESGILGVGDVKRMRDAGVNVFLVGEAFMRAEDPGLALKALFGA